jgi:Reprolysin family propeptide.
VVVTDPAYFSPVPTAGEVNLTSLPPLREYDLVIADPASFVADAGSGSLVALHLPGREFVLDLELVPAPVAEGARAFVKNESGTFEVAPPRIWFFEGIVAGEPGSSASFTVGDGVILGTIRCGATSLVIDQAGTVEVDGEQKIVHVVYDEQDVMPARGLHWFINP